MSNCLKGTSFAVAGHLSHRSIEDFRMMINHNGGIYYDDVVSGVNFVISTEEMYQVLNNPYKLQFMPHLTEQIDVAQTYSIPILEDSFVDKCIEEGHVVPVDAFIIPEFVIDVESKFMVKEDVPSNLPQSVQDIISMLFNEAELDRSLVDMGMDVRRIKLLTQNDIREAFAILKRLESMLQPSAGQTEQQHEAQLRTVSDAFYSLIPHRGSTPVIKTTEVIKEKSSLCEALIDFEIAQRLMNNRVAYCQSYVY
eukprot:TRINITY_DN65_c0_g1_i2.p1 TRINITY_DN65_c0_g1~~TRINITY_DN65_c0_g1_i2.p1  ORF type:complete len:262 (-),score=58.76 TRINITY_DN65_c0_g1_i2:748-1506(-)